MEPLNRNRRKFMRTAGLATAATLLPAASVSASSRSKAGKLKLAQTPAAQIALPFETDALEPVISEKTIDLHYGKHHKGYADKMLAAIKDGPLANKSLEDIVIAASKSKKLIGLFNNAAQTWNHNFYWLSLTPKSKPPTGKLLSAIESDFGSLEACKKQLADTSVAQFASGWGWLVLERGKLKVVSTSNADVPFLHGQLPLLTVDVWEHAYYLDHQNRRAAYVQAVIDKLLNWDWAAEQFARAKG